MSLAAIVFVVLGAFLLGALLLMALVLFAPLVCLIDSASWQMRFRWLAAIEYWRPLPGAAGEIGLSIAGKSIALPAGRTRRKRARRKPRRPRARSGRFLRRCLGSPSLRRALARRLRELWRGVRSSVTLTRRQIRLSLSDPAWNGILEGWLAWRGGSASSVSINFRGENTVLLEVRIYPYRIAKALLVFLARLPYRALVREWRASSAIASG